MEITPYQEMFLHYFTDAEAFSEDGNSVTFLIHKNLDINEKIIYANVQEIRYEKGPSHIDRGKLYHTLVFFKKVPYERVPGNSSYFYTFNVINSDPKKPFRTDIAFNVTIQPFNTSLAKISYLDSDLKRITFNVRRNGPYKLQKKYVIKSYCLNNSLECNATCVDVGNNKTEGPTVTFELSDVDDYRKISLRIHCQFYFAEKNIFGFGHGDWSYFKKSKSVKKRTKTVVKKTSKRSASPKRIVKNVKKQTKRSRPVKNE